MPVRTASPGITIQEIQPPGSSHVTVQLYDDFVLCISHSQPPSAVLIDLVRKVPTIIVPNCGECATYDEKFGRILVVRSEGKLVEWYGKKGVEERIETSFVVRWVMGFVQGGVLLVGKDGEIGYLEAGKAKRAGKSVDGKILGLWRSGNGGVVWIVVETDNTSKILYEVTLRRGQPVDQGRRKGDEANKKVFNADEMSRDGDVPEPQIPITDHGAQTEVLLKGFPLPDSIRTIASLCDVGKSLAILDSNGVLNVLRSPFLALYLRRKLPSSGSQSLAHRAVVQLSDGYILSCHGFTATIWDVTYGVCHSEEINLGGTVQSISHRCTPTSSRKSPLDFRVYASISGRGVVSIMPSQKLGEVSLADAMQAMDQAASTTSHLYSQPSKSLKGVSMDVHNLISSSAQAASVGSSFRELMSRAMDIDKRNLSKILQTLTSTDQKDALGIMQNVMKASVAGTSCSEQVTAAVVARSLLGILEANRQEAKLPYIKEWCKIISKSIRSSRTSCASVTKAVMRMRCIASIGGTQNNMIDILTQEIGRELVIEHVLDNVGDLSAKDYVRASQYALRCNHNHLMERVISTRIGRGELVSAVRSIPLRDVWMLLSWCMSKLDARKDNRSNRRGDKTGEERREDKEGDKKNRVRKRRKRSTASLEGGVLLWVDSAIDAHFSSLVVDEGEDGKSFGGLQGVYRTVQHLRRLYEHSATLLGMITHIEEHAGMPEGTCGVAGDLNYSVERLKVPLPFVQT